MRVLIAALALWAPTIAHAQSAVQAPMHLTAGPSHRGYWNAGFVRVPTMFDIDWVRGDGYRATTGGVGVGLHVGVHEKVYVDASIAVHVGGGKATSAYGERTATALDWNTGSTVGAKVYLTRLGEDWRMWLVAFSGFSYSVASMYSKRPPEQLDAGRFDVRSRAMSSPLGLFATLGNEAFQVSPIAYASWVWRLDLHTDQGEPPGRIPSDSTFRGDLTTSVGVDFGLAPGGQYFGVTWHHAVGIGPSLPYDTVVVRFTWALRLNKVARQGS